MNAFLSSLLLCVGLSCGAVLAASDAPHDIAPPIPTQNDNAADSDSDEIGYEEKPAAPIIMGKIDKVSTDSYGTLAEGQGGLSESVWKNDDRAVDEFLLSQIHSGVANDTIRDLVIKLLMTQSSPPQGVPSNDWFTLRLNALAGLGQDAKVMEMLQSIPQSVITQNMLQFQAAMEMAHGDYDKACKQALPGAGSADEAQAVFWQKLNIACKARDGKRDEAAVGLDMLHETGGGDPFFQEAIAHINDKVIPIKSLPKKISLFDFALIRIGGATEMLKDKIDALPPIAIKYLAEDPNIDIKLREKATTKAQQTGLLPFPEGNKTPEMPFARPVASDVISLVAALGAGNKQATEADNAVIARLALDETGIIDNRRIEKLLTLMQIFGYKVPDATWQKLFAYKNRFDGEAPPAILVDWINQAALTNRKSEVILLAALIANGNDADKISDLALVPVVKALKAAGYGKEARTIAYDAVKMYH